VVDQRAAKRLPCESRGKRGQRLVHGDMELVEKLAI
jgi:hypothetical protein